MLRLILLIAVFSITHFPMAGHAQTAYLQSNRVFSDDIAELIIELDSKIPSLYALDTSVLEADFEVLGVKSSISRVFEAGEAFHLVRTYLDGDKAELYDSPILKKISASRLPPGKRPFFC